MDEIKIKESKELDKERISLILTEELPVLRAKLGLSQEELCSIIGISRQTYGAFENKKRKMSWNNVLMLILFYNYNEMTRDMIESIGAFPVPLQKVLNVNKRKEEE